MLQIGASLANVKKTTNKCRKEVALRKPSHRYKKIALLMSDVVFALAEVMVS